VELNELFTENVVHACHVGRVSPIGVVDTRKCYPLALAAEGGEHHVRGVDRVNEVGREGGVLLLLVDGLLVEVLGDGD